MFCLRTVKARQWYEQYKPLNEDDKEIKTTSIDIPKSSWWSVNNAMTISTCVLVFSLFVIIIVARLIQKKEDSCEPILRTFGIILIVVLAVFLIVAGYSDRQIAPDMGLFGTIAGYLLSKETK